MVTYISAAVTPTVKGYWTGFRQPGDRGLRHAQTTAHFADRHA